MGDFVKAVVAAHPGDPSAPSVLCSWIESKKEFYCSVVRYAQRMGQGKFVVCSCTHAVLDDCLAGLKELWEAQQ